MNPPTTTMSSSSTSLPYLHHNTTNTTTTGTRPIILPSHATTPPTNSPTGILPLLLASLTPIYTFIALLLLFYLLSTSFSLDRRFHRRDPRTGKPSHATYVLAFRRGPLSLTAEYNAFGDAAGNSATGIGWGGGSLAVGDRGKLPVCAKAGVSGVVAVGGVAAVAGGGEGVGGKKRSGEGKKRR
ncbi:hypothetical protein K490DRAFT_66464 [Saccharata proteae CBS 121410]|uniref:Uncharacterized protein n=1 Tax=Saccharata proteae CBS 121410 TaxID=1314787 RepID=A0A9P4HUC7_9PEZI|nr:hypothetical protein K490DRAFT_66464 [Saccharata proteae CBS 121410]